MTDGRSGEFSHLQTTIVGLSSAEADSSELLRTLSQNEGLLSNHAAAFLRALNPKDHSMAYVFILWCWDSTNRSHNRLDYVKFVSHFAKESEGKLDRKVSGKFLTICRRLKTVVLELDSSKSGVLPLFHAATKLSGNPESLTPLHVDFLQLCLLAKTYSAAKPFLLSEFYDLDPTVSSLTPTDYLLYCYYGGRLCVGLKWYSRALELFHLALVAPTLVINAITLMIYKFYILVSLLENGTVSELPRFASGAVVRLSRSPSIVPYLRLAEAYKEDIMETVRATVVEHQEAFEEDLCLGLVKQLVSKLAERDIKKLTQAYLSLSLQDIETAIGTSNRAETESILLSMVQRNEINVEINSVTGMVKFFDASSGYDDVETSSELDEMLQEVIRLGERMEDVKTQIELDPEYRAKVFQNKQHSKADVNDFADR